MIRRTIVVNQSLATSPMFTINLEQMLMFKPKKLIIRQILYCNIAGTDSGTYLIWSSIGAGEYIGAVYVGIQGNTHMPENVIDLPNSAGNITFNITPANAAFTGPTGQLTMTCEFLSE